ncbi:MAG: OB-fold nucleic acid binding domain-containing protein, partial [Kiloniellales bacterium]
YGFPKGHAAAYAMVAYQTAYLKANYPVEFLAASMTFDMGNTDKLNVFRQELDRLGIPLLLPDINRSRADFGVEASENGDSGARRAIRYALAALKNVGEAAMTALVAERDRNGPFKGLGDLADRVDARAVNKRQIESLACAGAFDGLEPNRRRVFEAAETIVRHASAAASERESAQESLFGNDEDAARPDLAPIEVTDWPAMERLRHEFEAIGFYLSAHPLDAYGAGLARLGVVRSTELAAQMARDPGRKKLAGIVIGKQERTSRQGNRFAFLQLSDASGVYEVVVFSELLARVRELLDAADPLLLTVESRGDGEELRLMAQEIEPLEGAVAVAGLGLRVFMSEPEPLESLKSLLAREAEGRGRIALVLDLAEGQEVELDLPVGYRLSPAVRQAIKAVPGLTVLEA